MRALANVSERMGVSANVNERGMSVSEWERMDGSTINEWVGVGVGVSG